MVWDDKDILVVAYRLWFGSMGPTVNQVEAMAVVVVPHWVVERVTSHCRTSSGTCNW